MMEDYIKLITKLLKDKEDLTSSLEHLEQQLQQAQTQTNDATHRLQELSRDKEQHINKTKQQIDDFLQIIEQYEQEADH